MRETILVHRLNAAERRRNRPLIVARLGRPGRRSRAHIRLLRVHAVAADRPLLGVSSASRLQTLRSKLYARALAEFVARHDDDRVTALMDQTLQEAGREG